MNIDLSGEYRVAATTVLKEQLQAALAENTKVTICFKGITEADLSFFELLHTALRAFSNKHVELVLAPDMPEQLWKSASRTGFAHLCQTDRYALVAV